jgi:hypothetical protein
LDRDEKLAKHFLHIISKKRLRRIGIPETLTTRLQSKTIL